MPSSNYNSILTEARNSLERIQNFEVESLVQEKDLGAKQNFRDAIPYASKCVAFAKLIAVDSLSELPEANLTTIRNQCNAVFSVFDQILKFAPEQHGAGQRQQYINQCEGSYNELFAHCVQFLAFSVGRTADFKRLENEGRAAVQLVKDQTEELIQSLKERETEGQQILEDIRKVAAEQGVSQQASYFRDEARSHATESEVWKGATIKLSIALGCYAILSLALHKIPWIAPGNTYETVQMAISKVLIFGVLSFLVYLSARNFLAHKHNAIINKHRQNGLMTFKALVDASGNAQGKEVILNHAAASIFAPQATGYASDSSSDGTTAKSVVEVVGSTVAGRE